MPFLSLLRPIPIFSMVVLFVGATYASLGADWNRAGEELQSNDPETQVESVLTLRGATSLSPEQLKRLLNSQNPRIRIEALMSVMVRPFPEALSLLESSLKDDYAEVRSQAALAIGGYQRIPESSKDSLTRALKDQNVWVRFAAAESLVGFGEEERRIVYEFLEALNRGKIEDAKSGMFHGIEIGVDTPEGPQLSRPDILNWRMYFGAEEDRYVTLEQVEKKSRPAAWKRLRSYRLEPRGIFILVLKWVCFIPYFLAISLLAITFLFSGLEKRLRDLLTSVRKNFKKQKYKRIWTDTEIIQKIDEVVVSEVLKRSTSLKSFFLLLLISVFAAGGLVSIISWRSPGSHFLGEAYFFYPKSFSTYFSLLSGGLIATTSVFNLHFLMFLFRRAMSNVPRHTALWIGFFLLVGIFETAVITKISVDLGIAIGYSSDFFEYFVSRPSFHLLPQAFTQIGDAIPRGSASIFQLSWLNPDSTLCRTFLVGSLAAAVPVIYSISLLLVSSLRRFREEFKGAVYKFLDNILKHKYVTLAVSWALFTAADQLTKFFE